MMRCDATRQVWGSKWRRISLKQVHSIGEVGQDAYKGAFLNLIAITKSLAQCRNQE
jgi:hypothetical protein